MLKDRRVDFTMTAVSGGAAMGFNVGEMLDVVSSLENKNLYKSMTAHADHTVWHDVYHADTRRGVVYLKLTIVENLLIISFKEKGE